MASRGEEEEGGKRYVTPLTFDSLETGLTDAALLPASRDEAAERGRRSKRRRRRRRGKKKFENALLICQCR